MKLPGKLQDQVVFPELSHPVFGDGIESAEGASHLATHGSCRIRIIAQVRGFQDGFPITTGSKEAPQCRFQTFPAVEDPLDLVLPFGPILAPGDRTHDVRSIRVILVAEKDFFLAHSGQRPEENAPEEPACMNALGHSVGRCGRLSIIGASIATFMQVVVPRDALLPFGSHPALSVLALMILAYILTLCSEADAFIAATFAGYFSPGAVVIFMVFGPMMDVKNPLMLLGGFKTRFVVFLSPKMKPFAILASILFGVLGILALAKSLRGEGKARPSLGFALFAVPLALAAARGPTSLSEAAAALRVVNDRRKVNSGLLRCQ